MAKKTAPKPTAPASDEPALTLPPPPAGVDSTAPATTTDAAGVDPTAPAAELPDITTLNRDDFRFEYSYPMGLTQAKIVHPSGHQVTITRVNREQINLGFERWIAGEDPNTPADA